MNAIDLFRAAIVAAGLSAPDDIHDDGRIHRFSTNGKPRDKSGWYCLHSDGIAAGVFGCWRSGMQTTWSAKAATEMTQAERDAHCQRIEAMRAKREAEQAQRQQEAAKIAADWWAHAAPAPASHPYLVRKGIKPHSVRMTKDGTLLVPMHDASGKLWNLERIPAEAEAPKKGLYEGRRKGCYHAIGEPSDVIVVCEGFATGASIHECTGHAVAVAFNAGNLLEVAQALRSKHPALRIVLAADDDWKGTEGNIGMDKAREATQAVGALLAVPVFGPGRAEKATDFNDLHQTEGGQKVACLIGAVLAEKATSSPLLTANPANAANASGAGNGAHDWPVLEPLQGDDNDELPAPMAFPSDALGGCLGAAAAAIARDVQAPEAMAGGSILAAAALAVQSLADVVLPFGQSCPLSLYVVTSAGSGDRKSAIDRAVCHAIDSLRKERTRKWVKEKQAWEEACGMAKKGDPQPPEPVLNLLTIGNATVEGVLRQLKTQGSLGIFSPDGGDVLGGHSMKDSNRPAAIANFLKAWSGESIDTLRGGAGFQSLLGRRLSMSIMVQPVLLRQLLSDPLADGQGFLARCLIAQPATLAGTRMLPLDGEIPDPLGSPEVQAYNDRMAELLSMQPQLHQLGDGYELDPRRLPLSPTARRLWVSLCNHVEEHQAPKVGELEHARAFASKAGEHAARIAGVIALFQNPHAFEIDAQVMEGAMKVTNFYLSEHLRLTGAGKQERADSRLRLLLEFMRTRAPFVAHSDVLQYAPLQVRKLKAKGIKLLLDELAQRGYIRATGREWEVRNGV